VGWLFGRLIKTKIHVFFFFCGEIIFGLWCGVEVGVRRERFFQESYIEFYSRTATDQRQCLSIEHSLIFRWPAVFIAHSLTLSLSQGQASEYGLCVFRMFLSSSGPQMDFFTASSIDISELILECINAQELFVLQRISKNLRNLISQSLCRPRRIVCQRSRCLKKLLALCPKIIACYDPPYDLQLAKVNLPLLPGTPCDCRKSQGLIPESLIPESLIPESENSHL